MGHSFTGMPGGIRLTPPGRGSGKQKIPGKKLGTAGGITKKLDR
jgi:hypothetical protein